MDKELIMWILTGVLGGIDIGSLIAVAIIILKGVAKRVEDSTGIKNEVVKLNKKLGQVIEQNQQLQNKYDTLMLQMKGINNNVSKNVGIHREIKK